jgi:leucyl-tRNA synthetase
MQLDAARAAQQAQEWDDKYLVADEMTIVVQVNGKLRAELKLPQGTSDDDVKSAALEPENVVRAIGDGQVLKTIYIPGKLVNLVVK